MKIKNIVFFLVLIVFIIILPTIVFIFSNFIFEKNFLYANSINKKLEKIFKDNNYLNFKKADYYYKVGEYQKALELYLKINCKNKNECLILYHNIGNTFYKLGKEQKDLQQKIFFWQNSISNYLKGLSYKYDEKTKYNYEYVLEQLKKLVKNEKDKEKQEKQKNEEIKNNTSKNENNSENNSEKNEKKEQNQQNSQNNQNNQQQEQIIPKQKSIEISPDHQNAKKPLDENELKALNDYIEQLKQEEKQNLKLNKPKQSRDIFDILRQDFFFEGFDRQESEW